MTKEKGYITGPNWVHISTIPLKLSDLPKVKEAKHSTKWDDCVQKVQDKSGDAYNAYAVCTAAMGASSYERKEAVSGTSQIAQLRGKKKESSAPIKKNIFKFRETSLDNFKMHRFDVSLIKEGLGNFKDRFFYTKEALKDAAEKGIFNGVQCFADHPSQIEEQVQPERSTESIMGYYENVKYQEDESGQGTLVADLCVPVTISKDWQMALLTNSVEYSKKFKDRDFVGLSINAGGPANPMDLDEFMKSQKFAEPVLVKLIEALAQGINQVYVVTELTEVTSVDFVTKAGAGGRINSMIEGKKKL